MGTLGIILLVVFVIVCLLLVLLVAIQGDEENGMGGLLGGRGTAAFGAHSASVLTKTTCVLVVLFFVLSVGIAMLNKKSNKDTVITNAPETEESVEVTEETSDWWSSAEETVEAEVTETVEAEAVEVVEE